MMDYSLLALIGMIVAAMITSTRLDSRSWPGRPGWQYQRVLAVGFFSLLLLVPGLIGWDLRRSGGWFNGAHGRPGVAPPPVAAIPRLLIPQPACRRHPAR